MAVQTFTYKKVSQLPSVSQLAESDVFIVNKDGETSKITLDDLITIFNGAITTDISDIKTRLGVLENTTSTLASNVNDNTMTINNIITAGFNLIGVDTK